MKTTLPPIDGEKPFFAPKNMRFNGQAYVKGQQLNIDGIDPRKIAQLYALRTITQAEPAEAVELPADTSGADLDAPIALSDDEKARVLELIDGNTREALDALAAAEPYSIEGADKLPNKGAVAEAIVIAERSIEPAKLAAQASQ